MLSDLRSERSRLEEAIAVLERLASGGSKRRGRPPKWMAEAGRAVTAHAPGKAKRRFSAETRIRMAEAQRRRWAAVKKSA